MKNQDTKYARKTARVSFLTTVIGISLVLFLVGTAGWLILGAQKLSNEVKQNIQVDLFFKEAVPEVDMRFLEQKLKTEGFVRSAQFIHKDTAAQRMMKKYGADFFGPLHYNPIHHSIEMFLKPSYANLDSLKFIEEYIMETNSSTLTEMYYNSSMLKDVNKNSTKIIYIIITFAVLLLFIALTLINHTIRLAVYAKRLLIRTMQLVGAKSLFIMRPFLANAILQGLLSGLIASLLLACSLLIAKDFYEQLIFLVDTKHLMFLFMGITTLGVLVTILATYFALLKYLRLDTDKLF